MKTQISKLIILALVSMLFVGSAQAQNKPNKDESRKKKKKELQKKELDSIAEQSKTEYEFELQRLLEEQSNAMDEQSEAMDELFKSLDEIEDLADLKDIRVVPYKDFFAGKDFKLNMHNIPSPQMYMFDGDFREKNAKGDNTTFSISKRMKEGTTFSGDFEFTIPDKCKGIFFSFSGSLESGNLKVTFTKPDKKIYQEFKVTPIADVRWNKSMKEDDMKEFFGTWKVTISAQDAKGNYSINISSH